MHKIFKDLDKIGHEDNIIIKDIFTKEDYIKIYDHINSAKDNKILEHPKMGYKIYQNEMPSDIMEKVLKTVQPYFDFKLKLKEIAAARYCNNYISDPSLHPHFDGFGDDSHDPIRITLDVQLKSTFNWKLFVEGKSFTLNDNEALVFSGTNQIHWREKINFKKDDFVDMLFCHFVQDCENPKFNSEDFQKNLELKESDFQLKYKNNTL
jgi:hypothetical protein